MKSRVLSLGYVGISTSRLADWADFGTQFLGFEIADKSTGTLSFRMDEAAQRFQLEAGQNGTIQHLGWQVEDAHALQEIAARLDAAGIHVRQGDAVLAAQRGVRELIWMLDPAGNRVELFWGQEMASTPFVPGRNIAGFRTGNLGIGHAVLTCRNVEQVLPFYTELLGFGISDYVLRPFKAYFMHVNARHHSFALIESEKRGVHHLMMELMQFDDIGHAHDLAQMRNEDIAVTLGRHSNDFMTSFYVKTPSDFMIEYGWGGRAIDPQTWQAFELTDGPSIWGHNRSWLSAEANAVLRAQLADNAASGLRQPVQVQPGNHVLIKDRQN
ncbi:VOC family protein [Pandoraea nosoerga]|uniref:Biphenyl 2,3-dioxygenase n=1 Tax=Pandoraea nosoerga TaxID=2508296 RepID=A0A5E4W2W3_9BURK|nr:VOC family protein [Pandoraea nosoerga]VVE17976.1 biphenyl 2,3-dioxygenase [Pandoraea nosoerga]